MATPDIATQVEAINTLAGVVVGAIALMGLQVLALGFLKPSSRAFLIAAYVLWVGIATCLAWLVFSPAVRAVRVISSPIVFPILGFVVAAILASLKATRQDAYGIIEIAFGLTTLLIVGRVYDSQPELTVLVTMAGAIYVLVRGFNNIGDHWKKRRERDAAGRSSEQPSQAS